MAGKQGLPGLPAAPTLFRALIRDRQGPELVARMMAGLPLLLRLRFRDYVEAIEQAATVQELVDLAWAAQGPAEPLWHSRLAAHGQAATPVISERLRTLRVLRDGSRRRTMLQRLIGELRWQDDAGAQILQERFGDLDDDGQAYASVALGLLGARGAADRLWEFYCRVDSSRRPDRYVGALWGLIDLGDPRAAAALTELLRRQRHFYELYGFLALAGDPVAATLLAGRIGHLPEREREAALLAMVAIAHRAGREAMLAQFIAAMQAGDSLEEVTEVVDELLSRPPDLTERYFELFYHGFTAQNLQGLLPVA